MSDSTHAITRIDTQPLFATGRSYFDPKAFVLQLNFMQRYKMLECPFEKTLLLGRAVEDDSTILDLLPFGAKELAVSRRHALIIKHNVTLMIMDLRSANGTYINGQRLSPNTTSVLRDGDKLLLGGMMVEAIFAVKPDISL